MERTARRARRILIRHRQLIGVSALTALTIIALIGIPLVPGSGSVFDTANGLGLAAIGALAICCWLAPAGEARYTLPELRLHGWLGLVVTAAVFVHALVLLLTNDVAIEYLKWRAPAYMHAGNIGFLLLVVLCVLPLRPVRRVLHRDFKQFRSLHRGLSALATVLAGWHVIGSGYLTGAGHGVATAWSDSAPGFPALLFWWRGALLAVLLSLITLLWWYQPFRARSPLANGANPGVYAVAIMVLAALYALLLQEVPE